MRSPEFLTPSDLSGGEPAALDQFSWRFLAEGDSWFSIGSLNPFKNSNLLHHFEFQRKTVVVNCAQPGDTLRHLAELGADPWFQDLLCGARATRWDGIVLSAGGNDLIDAAQVLPAGPAAADASLRLLLKPSEWGVSTQGVSRFISEQGWRRFADYVRVNFDELIGFRDGARSESRGAPLFVHTYAVPTPRNAPSGPLGPWLYPAMRQYQLPVTEWMNISGELMRRLGSLLSEIAANPVRYPNVHVFDSASQVAIEPARLGDTGVSGDWANEIHLSRRGCAKVGAAWSRQIDAVLKGV